MREKFSLNSQVSVTEPVGGRKLRKENARSAFRASAIALRFRDSFVIARALRNAGTPVEECVVSLAEEREIFDGVVRLRLPRLSLVG